MSRKNDAKGGKAAAIDYRDTPKEKAVARPFPATISDEYRVHISPEAYRRMKAHAATSDEVELCGVMVGDVCQDDQGLYLSVTGAIEGEGANTYGTQVTFTQQTWDHIHRVRERDYPNAQIVGWFHTHPGFGVFLSGMDTFIQENFFNAPYQIAIVLETKTKQEGCFGWVDGKITALRRYWVGNTEVRLATGEAEPFDDGGRGDGGSQAGSTPDAASPDREIEPPPAPLGLRSLILMAALCVALGVLWGYSLTRKTMFEALQSEFYCLLEFTGINSAAAQDMHEVKAKVSAVRQALEKTGEGDQTKELQEIEHLLATYERDYLKRDQATFRKRLNQIAGKRQDLAARVDDANRVAHEFKMEVIDIYMLRVQDILYRSNAASLEQMPPADAAMVRLLIDRVLRIEPAYKDVLQKLVPDLMKSLYAPPPAKEKAPAATKKED